MRQLSRWFMALLAGGAVTWALWAMLQPVLPDSSALATLAGFMAALFALHKLAQGAEARGWIYYQKRHGSWGAVGAAMSEVHAIYRPGERYVKQLKEDAYVYEEDDDEGDGRHIPVVNGRSPRALSRTTRSSGARSATGSLPAP